MKKMSGPEFSEFLEREGWRLASSHAGHNIFTMHGMKSRIAVPLQGDRPLKPGLIELLWKIVVSARVRHSCSGVRS